jgi:hypothetical protein
MVSAHNFNRINDGLTVLCYLSLGKTICVFNEGWSDGHRFTLVLLHKAPIQMQICHLALIASGEMRQVFKFKSIEQTKISNGTSAALFDWPFRPVNGEDPRPKRTSAAPVAWPFRPDS